MSTEANKAIVRRFFDELNRKNFGVYDDVVAAEVTFNGAAIGREGLRGFSTMLRTAFPDLWVRAEEVVAEGDLVAIYYAWGGTHRVEATGRGVRRRAYGRDGVGHGRLVSGSTRRTCMEVPDERR